MSQPSPETQALNKLRDRDLLWYRKQPDRVNFDRRVKVAKAMLGTRYGDFDEYGIAKPLKGEL